MKIKTPDLTTPGQKMIAGAIVGVVLLTLWFALPPLITILKNIYLMAALGLPLAVGIFFHDYIWEEAKRLSWNLTKKRISNDPLWYMWRGYEYLVNENKALNNDIQNMSTVRIQNEKLLADTVKQLKNEQAAAVRKETEGAPPSVLKILRNKVALLDNQFNTMSPKVDVMKEYEKEMISYYEDRVTETTILQQTLELKAQELEMLKSMAAATKNASEWLKTSKEMREFKHSLKEIDFKVATYTASVEDFRRNALTTIQSSASSGLELEGIALIEQYKKERLALAS